MYLLSYVSPSEVVALSVVYEMTYEYLFSYVSPSDIMVSYMYIHSGILADSICLSADRKERIGTSYFT